MWKIELQSAPVGGLFPMRRAKIIASDCTRSGAGPMQELSPELVTIEELEAYLTLLRQHLDRVEQDGRRYFSTPLPLGSHPD